MLQKCFSGTSTAKAKQSSRHTPRSTTALSSLLPVETIVLEKQKAYQVGRSYTGKIESYRSSELGFEGSGQVLRIEVNKGNRVSKGIPLAYLDTRNLVAQEQEILAQRAQAVARLREMQAGSCRQTIAAALEKRFVEILYVESNRVFDRGSKSFTGENLYFGLIPIS